ncbi:AcrR family transcriptional regulator [Bradyrhizobium japonicum]
MSTDHPTDATGRQIVQRNAAERGERHQARRHAEPDDRERLRAMLDHLAKSRRDELSNIPLSACWPEICRLIEAAAHPHPDVRNVGLEHFFDAIARQIIDTARRMRACDAVVARHERAVAEARRQIAERDATAKPKLLRAIGE